MMREDRSWAEKQTFKRKGIKVKVSPRKGQWETGIIKGEKCLCYRYAPPFRHLGFSYLGYGVSLHGCSSKVQPLLLTLDKVAPPDLECGVAPLCAPTPVQLPLLERGVAPRGHCP